MSNKLSNRRKLEGLTWFNKRTGQLRYSSSKDSPINYLQPLEVYKVAETVRRNEALSIATEKDTDYIKASLGDKYLPAETYLIKTNAASHKKTVGLALEPGEPGDEVHIQSSGKFVIDTKADTNDEYIPNFTSESIGKLIYVDGTNKGLFCLEDSQYWKNYKNIICIGTLTDAPEENSTQNEIVISLNIEGDNRGLLDTSQFEFVVGEKFSVPSTDQFRVFAVGKEEATKFSANLSFSKVDSFVVPTKAFILLSRMDGKSAFININSNDIPASSASSDINDNDIAAINLARSWANNDLTKIKVINLGLSNFTSYQNSYDFLEELKVKLTEAFNFISDMNLDFTYAVKEVDNSTLTLTASDFGGYYSIHASTGLSQVINYQLIQAGSYFNKGRAVLADIRIDSRQDIIGAYYSGKYDTEYNVGDSAIFLRLGRFEKTDTDTTPFKIGKEYYLGINGQVLDDNSMYTELDSSVKIGFAQSEKAFIVDVGDPRQYERGAFPVGYLKPSPNLENNSVPEYGFLLCDGKTKLREEDYPELFSRLKQYFTEDQLSVEDE